MLNQLTDFHKPWYPYHVTVDHPVFINCFSLLLIIPAVLTSQVEAACVICMQIMNLRRPLHFIGLRNIFYMLKL
jgi:hypothetical protein